MKPICIDRQFISYFLTCKEGLCEVEARHPEGCRRIIINPVLEELKATKEVWHVRPKGFQGRVGFGCPNAGLFSNQHGVEDLLKLRGHDHQTLDGLL